MAVLDKLQNISSIEFNSTIINSNNTKELSQNLLINLKNNLGGFWIDATLFVFFLFLLFKFTNKYDINSYDSIRGIFLSSGFTLIMSLGLLLSGWSENIYPLFLYGIIFLISMLYTYELKQKE